MADNPSNVVHTIDGDVVTISLSQDDLDILDKIKIYSNDYLGTLDDNKLIETLIIFKFWSIDIPLNGMAPEALVGGRSG